MALGWISLLKTVPWVEVLSSAPAVAEGAKKLWRTVAKKDPVSPESMLPPIDPSLTLTLPQMQLRLTHLETTVAELHQQMLDSSVLIQALADQNSALLKRVETHRRRLLWLSGVVFFSLMGWGLSLSGVFQH